MDKRRLLLIVVFSFATAYALHVASRQLRLSAKIDAQVIIPAATVPPASRSLRPNYPYSVIPGGAYSPAELRSAVQREPLVRSHYADFNLDSAHLVTLTDDRFQFVSYRLNNHIYWTRNKLHIPKGEVLLTDGRSFARTRCGNRLSTESKPEMAAEQPALRLLSLPPFTPALLKSGEVTLAPPPPVENSPAGAPALPFDLPRLAPYFPSQTADNLPVASQMPSLQSYPPSAVIIASGPPPIGASYVPVVPTSPGKGSPAGQIPGPEAPPGIIPILPIVPITPGTPVPPVSVIPEPATLSLFAASFCGLLWLLTRVIRTNARPQE